jgi:hypothetical protein
MKRINLQNLCYCINCVRYIFTLYGIKYSVSSRKMILHWLLSPLFCAADLSPLRNLGKNLDNLDIFVIYYSCMYIPKHTCKFSIKIPCWSVKIYWMTIPYSRKNVLNPINWNHGGHYYIQNLHVHQWSYEICLVNKHQFYHRFKVPACHLFNSIRRHPFNSRFTC